jgi:nucleotide-binding universal stress UspA family protein
MFDKILVPLDTSPFAEQVIPSIIELARSFHSEIDLISICEEHRRQDAGTCRQYLEDKASQIEKALAEENLKLKKDILIGSPGQKILSYAAEEKVSLIAMSSHGLSGVTLWPLGSTVDKVLRKTGQPILIIRVKETLKNIQQEDIFKRILVPLDGSELGARVVPYAVELAARFGSEVVLYHVIQTDKHLHSLGRIDTVPIREDEMDLMQKRFKEYLEGVKRQFEGSGASIKSIVTSGNVAEEIIKYASKNNCGLITLSNHAHSGLEAWIIGSITNKILHAGQTSLLFVPAIES